MWTPLILLLVPALVRSWSTLPDWSRWMLVGGVLYTLGQGWYSPFHGGDAFYGYRLGLGLLTAATPALAMSWDGMGRTARRWIGPVVGLQFALISLGAMVNGLFIDQTQAWTDNAFLAACRAAPVLWVWPLLFMGLGGLSHVGCQAAPPSTTTRPQTCDRVERRRGPSDGPSSWLPLPCDPARGGMDDRGRHRRSHRRPGSAGLPEPFGGLQRVRFGRRLRRPRDVRRHP